MVVEEETDDSGIGVARARVETNPLSISLLDAAQAWLIANFVPSPTRSPLPLTGTNISRYADMWGWRQGPL